MNVAIIMAGGRGQRMQADIPKQFIEVNDIPIIVYTLQAFQRHSKIDAIQVVCVSDWIEQVWEYAKQFQISKLKWVVEGGETGQTSCYQGLINLEDKIQPNDIVIIHDAIRPIVPKAIIDNMLRVAKLKGNACASLPMHETLIFTDNQADGIKGLDRNTVRRLQTPQAYHYGELLEVHKKALTKGITDSVYANTLMIQFGKRIYFSLGFDTNIKITTGEDIALFKALLSLSEQELVNV
jgi:2-C-methyl-D-erythritol 4-phosphate cytidylyltransferase